MALARRPGGPRPHLGGAERGTPWEDRQAGGGPRLVLPGARILLRRARACPRPLLGPDRLLLRPQRRRGDRAPAELESVALLRQPLHRTGGGGGRRRRLGPEGIPRLGAQSG